MKYSKKEREREIIIKVTSVGKGVDFDWGSKQLGYRKVLFLYQVCGSIEYLLYHYLLRYTSTIQTSHIYVIVQYMCVIFHNKIDLTKKVNT